MNHFCAVKGLSSLLQYKPPLEVNDLFEDIKDGVKLLALLEVLSGQRLVSSLHVVFAQDLIINCIFTHFGIDLYVLNAHVFLYSR